MGAQFQVDVNVVTHGAEKVNELEHLNSELLNSNSRKATDKLRKIKRKFN